MTVMAEVPAGVAAVDRSVDDEAGAARASRLRGWVSVGLVAVVAGALTGGLAWVAASQKVVTTVSPATPQRLVVVPEAAGLYQVSSPQLGTIAAAAREGLTRAGTPNAVAAFYGPSAVGDPSVFVAGGSAAAGATGNAALHTQLSQITAAARERGAVLGALRAYDAGAPGGALECQSVTGGALSSVCAWSDADTVAVVSSPALAGAGSGRDHGGSAHGAEAARDGVAGGAARNGVTALDGPVAV